MRVLLDNTEERNDAIDAFGSIVVSGENVTVASIQLLVYCVTQCLSPFKASSELRMNVHVYKNSFLFEYEKTKKSTI